MSDSKDYSKDNIFSAGTWGYVDASSVLLPALMAQVLSDPGTKKLEGKSVSGTLTIPFSELLKRIEVKRVGDVLPNLVIKKNASQYVYYWPEGYLDIDYTKKTNAITIATNFLNDELGNFLSDLDKEVISKDKKNLIFSIVQTTNGLDARSMGDGSSPLIAENYTPDVIADLNYVLESFKQTPPVGRIAVLNGEPGTGKTHLIRSMLTQLDCLFLIIPSNLIDSLDKPAFMPLLLSLKDRYEKPIVLVIEDGDACLVPRRGDNLSMISALLNLSDGILGSIMDIRMIISTNAGIKEMDEAIMRPGRLCKRIHVGGLPYDQANLVFQRLKEDTEATLEFRQKYTLAEIYSKVKNVEVALPVEAPQKRTIGFFHARTVHENTFVNKKSDD